jgi:hypothetical protein
MLEANMTGRTSVFVLLLLLTVLPADAKNKKKQVLPDYVLQAQTVVVVIYPDAGEPMTNPGANRMAQEKVEKALTKWGRFKLVMDAQTADLVVAVGKGHAGGPTVTNSPIDDRPVIIQPADGDIRIGGQEGRPTDTRDPGLINPSPGGPGDRGKNPTLSGPSERSPGVGSEIGMSEDTFGLYRGGVEYPLDASPVWRYTAKNAFDGPQVPAVEQFRKILTEAEKQHQQKP